MDWKRELVIAHFVKNEIERVDLKCLWENTLPEVPASEADVREVEHKLGHALDGQFRNFLLYANGWRAFKNGVDLFSTSDLLGGVRAERARDILRYTESLKDICGYEESEVMPVAVSSDDIDIMLMSRPGAADPGKVMWIAGGLIQESVGFDEWFLAMVDYLRLDYEFLAERHGLRKYDS
ncbi:SMI1/KNR4 family protein [Stenotrophomonas sp.]|uniref:SMI1/KNR4 family protein n=1 Tax=Stenotrophomonas sp. TaxID=69392 RepID=UPI002899A251|nr:SMI1/KNR4 family protein [Stenotrophomonas sp.]